MNTFKQTKTFLVLGLGFLLIGCGTQTSTETPTTPPTTEAPKTVETLTEEETAAYESAKAQAEEAQAERQEKLAETPTAETLATGSFAGIAPGHNAAGDVTVKVLGDEVMIELADNFSSDKGPDLNLVLSQEQTLTGEDPVQLDTSKLLVLEPLVSQSGSQVYTTSLENFKQFNHAAVVWCQKFNVVFGAAQF